MLSIGKSDFVLLLKDHRKKLLDKHPHSPNKLYKSFRLSDLMKLVFPKIVEDQFEIYLMAQHMGMRAKGIKNKTQYSFVDEEFWMNSVRWLERHIGEHLLAGMKVRYNVNSSIEMSKEGMILVDPIWKT